MSDKPSAPNLTFATLDKQESPTPFVYATKTGARVTFPDIFGLEFEEAEQFLSDIQRTTDNSVVLRKWLSPADYEKLRKDRLTLRQLVTLVESAQAHYEASVGSREEE